MSVSANKKASSLIKRWGQDSVAFGNPSPFGLTESGAHDYRGVVFIRKTLRNLTIGDADFYAADLTHLTVENCEFRNCNFENTKLTELATRESAFNDCRFHKSDLRMARVGYGGTNFNRCTFDGAKTARISFFNAVFTEGIFNGKDWNHVDFRASGFWNCSFKGPLKDVTFRGDYLNPSYRTLSGAPQRTGLHGCSFEDAQLYWVGFRNSCALENITLPADGSAFICNMDELFATCADLSQEDEGYDVLQKYLCVIRPGSTSQSTHIASRNDLVKIGGNEIGAMLFALLKTRLSKRP